tara:strand:- start:4769 stop:5008 length:240 start_codon:yes stop_codon:yes gene_type:complete
MEELVMVDMVELDGMIESEQKLEELKNLEEQIVDLAQRVRIIEAVVKQKPQYKQKLLDMLMLILKKDKEYQALKEDIYG